MKSRAKMVVVETTSEGATFVVKSIINLSSVTTVGLDLAKHVFQVHCVDASGCVVVAKAIRRNKLLEFFASLPPCLVGLKASGLCEALYSPAEERRLGCGGNLRGGDAAFDAVCRRALAREPGGVDASQDAGDVGFSANAIAEWLAWPLDRSRR